MPVRDNTVYKPNNTEKYKQWFVITIAGKILELRYFPIQRYNKNRWKRGNVKIWKVFWANLWEKDMK